MINDNPTVEQADKEEVHLNVYKMKRATKNQISILVSRKTKKFIKPT